jgi:Tfp pilus assembly protein PilV
MKQPQMKLRLRGNSLVEVLTGLSLLSLSMVLGLLLFQQLGGAYSVAQKARAYARSRSLLYASFQPEENATEQKWLFWTYQRKVSPVSTQTDLYEISVVCHYGEHPVYQLNRYATFQTPIH